MILDKLTLFSEAQAVTATAASTDVLDLGPIKGTVRDIGVGTPIEFFVQVSTTATAAGAATVNFQLQTSADNVSYTTIFDSGAVALAGLAAGKRPVVAKVPMGVKRYLRVNYTVGTGPLTAGAFTAGLLLDVDANYSYQSNFRVS